MTDERSTRTKHPFMMYDSIMSAPQNLRECLDTRIQKEIQTVARAIVDRNIQRVIITGCGTSLYSAFSNRIIWHDLGTGIEMFQDNGLDLVQYPYLNLGERDAIFGISHSGGTKAVEDCLKINRPKGVLTVAFTDVPGSRVFQAAEYSIVGPGGEDVAIPKTRSYLTQQYIIAMLGAFIAEMKGNTIDWDTIKGIGAGISETIKVVEEPIKKIAEKLINVRQFNVVGSGVNYANAFEAALKMIESTTVPANGLQVEEAAHGYELGFDKNSACIVMIPKDCKVTDRAINIINGTLCIGSQCIVICNDAQIVKGKEGALVVEVPQYRAENWSFFNFIIPLYLLAYYLTIAKGLNPDVSSMTRPEMNEAHNLFHPPGYH